MILKLAKGCHKLDLVLEVGGIGCGDTQDSVGHWPNPETSSYVVSSGKI